MSIPGNNVSIASGKLFSISLYSEGSESHVEFAKVAIKPANGSNNIPSYSRFSNSNFWQGDYLK